jgi:hypothetical protein
VVGQHIICCGSCRANIAFLHCCNAGVAASAQTRLLPTAFLSLWAGTEHATRLYVEGATESWFTYALGRYSWLGEDMGRDGVTA